jgi:hypothetical protein
VVPEGADFNGYFLANCNESTHSSVEACMQPSHRLWEFHYLQHSPRWTARLARIALALSLGSPLLVLLLLAMGGVRRFPHYPLYFYLALLAVPVAACRRHVAISARPQLT